MTRELEVACSVCAAGTIVALVVVNAIKGGVITSAGLGVMV
jgi:hypothetical protein